VRHCGTSDTSSKAETSQLSLITSHSPLYSQRSQILGQLGNSGTSAISEYTTCIKHIAGKSNTVADALSRTSINTVHQFAPGVDFTAMAAAQQSDQEMAAYRTAISGLKLQDVQFGPTNTTILCDISTGQPRPLVPASFCKTVFDTIHSLSHPFIRATQKLVTDRFVWHGIHKQVGNWVKTCQACQEAKIQRHIKAPLQTFDVPHRRFDHINIDIVGPLPSSQGHTHLLMIIDRFSRWPEAIPLKGTNTETCARALVFHWVARFGLPLDVTSDRGSQFISKVWIAIAKLPGTKLHHTTAYHPQANGLERFHRHLKTALRARLTTPNWMDELPWILLGIRTASKEDLHCSSAELVYGAPLTVPGDFVAKPQDSTIQLPSCHTFEIWLATHHQAWKPQDLSPKGLAGQ